MKTAAKRLAKTLLWVYIAFFIFLWLLKGGFLVFNKYCSHNLHLPIPEQVQYQSVALDFMGFMPHIALKNVRIEHEGLNLQAKKVAVYADWLSTIRTRSPVLSEIGLHEALVVIDVAEGDSDVVVPAFLANLDSISFINSDLHISRDDKPGFPLTDVYAQLTRTGSEFNLSAQGVFVAANPMNGGLWANFQLKDGRLHMARSFVQIENGSVRNFHRLAPNIITSQTELTFDAQMYNLHDDKRHSLHVLIPQHEIDLDINFVPTSDGFESLMTERQSGNNIFVKKVQEDYSVVTQEFSTAKYLQLFAGLVKNFPQTESIETFKPEAKLYKTLVEYSGGRLRARGRFTDFGFAATEFTPKIAGASGMFLFENGAGSVVLDGDSVDISYENQGALPITLSNYRLVVNISDSIDLLKLSAQINGQPFSGRGRFEAGKLHFMAGIPELDIEYVKTRLPSLLVGPQTVIWCKKSLHGGKFHDVNLVFNDFEPWRLRVSAPFSQTSLKYAPDWPALEKFDGVLEFKDKQLLVTTDKINTANIKLGSVTAKIDDLSLDPATIVINSAITTKLPEARKFIHNTPLQAKFKRLFESVEMVGDADIDLGLKILLTKPEPVVTPSGTVKLKDAKAHVADVDATAININGEVLFEGESLKPSILKANYDNREIQIKLDSTDEHFLASAVMHEDIKNIFNRINLPLNYWIKGSTLIDVGVMAPRAEGEPTYFLSSDLKNITISMPAPLGKPADKAQPFNVYWDYLNDKTQVQIKLDAPDLIQANSLWDLKDEPQVARAHVNFGPQGGTILVPKRPLLITGNLPEIDLEMWQTFSDEFFEQWPVVGERTKVTFDIFTRGIKYDNVKIGQQRVVLEDEDTRWRASLMGPSLSGQVTWPHTNSEPITIVLTDGDISYTQSKAKRKIPWPLPSVQFSADKLKLNDRTIYDQYIQVDPTPSGYQFDRIEGHTEHAIWRAQGYWDVNSEDPKVEFLGKLSTDGVGRMTKEFGYTTSVEEASGTIDFELGWPGGLSEFEWAKLNGFLSLDFGQGRIIGVKPGIGRVLSLLNLNTIFRRLQLDFSDVVSEGLAFDLMRANIDIQKGIARSRNWIIEGPAARINISGRYNLDNQQVKGNILVTPNVSGTLPLAAAITAGNPAVGAALWVVDRLTGGKLAEVSRYHYQIDGTLDNPDISDKGQVSASFDPSELQ